MLFHKCNLSQFLQFHTARLYRYAEELDKPAAAAAAAAPATAAAAAQGLVMRAVKEAKKAGDATKADVDAAVAKLLELKAAAEVGS